MIEEEELLRIGFESRVTVDRVLARVKQERVEGEAHVTRSQKDASRMRGQLTREMRDTVTAEGKLRARCMMKAYNGDA